MNEFWEIGQSEARDSCWRLGYFLTVTNFWVLFMTKDPFWSLSILRWTADLSHLGSSIDFSSCAVMILFHSKPIQFDSIRIDRIFAWFYTYFRLGNQMCNNNFVLFMLGTCATGERWVVAIQCAIKNTHRKKHSEQIALGLGISIKLLCVETLTLKSPHKINRNKAGWLNLLFFEIIAVPQPRTLSHLVARLLTVSACYRHEEIPFNGNQKTEETNWSENFISAFDNCRYHTPEIVVLFICLSRHLANRFAA